MDWKRILPLLTTLAATTLLGAILGGTITGAIFAGSATSPPPTPQASGPQTCNNQPAYCTRSYSNVTQIGSHDSAFVGPLLQQNQNLPITQQLDLGIRFLQAQTHKDPIDHSIIQLCHTSCFLEDAGSLESYLSTIKAWLDSHSDEVVTLLLTNGDGFSASSFGDVFESSGVKKYAFVPESSSDVLSIHDWPTLGHLIENGTRLIVFLGMFSFHFAPFPSC